MRNFNRNVGNYLSEEVLGTETYQIRDEIGWIPCEETEANFCRFCFIADGRCV